MASIPVAALHVRKRRIPLFSLIRGGRVVIGIIMVCAIVLGVVRYVQRSSGVLALEFAQHIVGQATGAVGVLGVAIGDMQGDGRQDIVTAGRDGVNVYIQQAGGTFEKKIIDDVRGERVLLADFDSDDSLDILVTVDANPSVKLYLSEGDAIEFTKTWIGSGSNAAIAAGDIDADGKVDILTSLMQGGEYVLQRWMNNGSGIFSSTTLANNTGVTALVSADIDSNGYADIITAGSKGLQTWDTNNGTSWSREDIDTSQDSFTTLAVGDVSGNGSVDIVAGDADDDAITYYRHIQHSAYQKVPLDDGADATSIQIVDINEDGAMDIVVASQDENSVYVFQNDGQDAFTRSTIATNLQSVFGVAVGDIDHDSDFDFTAGDHVRGTVYWYERTHAKPVATTPSAIAQTTDGSGRILFTTQVSQQDSARTRLRVEYSTDGSTWHKTYISSAKATKGNVDVNSDLPYQIGTVNPIDTDVYSLVPLTITWDTTSTRNLGGPIAGESSSVRIRLTPRDSVGNGNAVTSDIFRVDNRRPTTSGLLTVISNEAATAALSWAKPIDTNLGTYRVYYGIDRETVSNQTATQWKSNDDSVLASQDATGTTITGLTSGQIYYFKLVVRDRFGNESAWPIASQLISTTVTETPQESLSPTPQVSEFPEVLATPLISPLPTITVPPTTFENPTPHADAGPDQLVAPSALVILDGTASSDPTGEQVQFSWKQVAGPAVELLSDRTANPSFSTGTQGGSYIFQLTVKDSHGASSTDLVTVAVGELPVASSEPVATITPEIPVDTISETPTTMAFIVGLLKPFNLVLFIASLIVSSILILERFVHSVRSGARVGSVFSPGVNTPCGRVIHYHTGVPIAGVQVMVYGADGKLKATDHTNEKGEFSSVFPVGEYTIAVNAPGFVFAGGFSRLANVRHGLTYTGGKVTVSDPSKPLDIAIPMKPSKEEATSLASRLLPFWQALQYISRVSSWPIFFAGAAANTALIFMEPGVVLLIVEVLYAIIVVVKVYFEARMRPAYGLVRDAITHAPLDLAVVRLFDQQTNRLIMTRVANSQGKFFALPPSGMYMITVSKIGYAPFSRENVHIESAEDSVLQMTADLMPAAPVGAFAGTV